MEIINLKLKPDLIPILAKWHHDEWKYLNPSLTLQGRIKKMQSYFNDSAIPSTFVAINKTTVLGSAALIDSDMDTHPELSPWLASVYVDPPYRKQEVGSRLVNHLLKFSKGLNIGALYLFTPDRLSFYQKLGWTILNKEPYRGQTVWVMAYVFNPI